MELKKKPIPHIPHAAERHEIENGNTQNLWYKYDRLFLGLYPSYHATIRNGFVLNQSYDFTLTHKQ